MNREYFETTQSNEVDNREAKVTTTPVQTFPITTVLSGLILWIIFNYLGVTLNCDLQKLFKKSPISIHIAGVTAFYFLFTVLYPDNVSPIHLIWLKTIGVYLLFMMMTKSKMYFILPVIGLILVDQCMRQHVAYMKKTDKDFNETYYTQFFDFMLIVILVLIVIGFFDYIRIKRNEFGSDFSMYQIVIGTNDSCKFNK